VVEFGMPISKRELERRLKKAAEAGRALRKVSLLFRRIGWDILERWRGEREGDDRLRVGWFSVRVTDSYGNKATRDFSTDRAGRGFSERSRGIVNTT